MVPVTALWLPILLSAVLVFLASSVIHMLLDRWHRSDFRGVPDEAGVMNALRPFNIPRGDYIIPHGGGMEALKSPEFLEKYRQGPVALITVMKSGAPAMGPSLAQWFVYLVVVSIFAAYIAGRSLSPGAHYLEVFRFAGCTSYIGYALALWQDSIWYKRSWIATLKNNIDGLVYGLLTAGTFGWLWPSM